MLTVLPVMLPAAAWPAALVLLRPAFVSVVLPRASMRPLSLVVAPVVVTVGLR